VLVFHFFLSVQELRLGLLGFNPLVDSPTMSFIFEVAMILAKLVGLVSAVHPFAEHVLIASMLGGFNAYGPILVLLARLRLNTRSIRLRRGVGRFIFAGRLAANEYANYQDKQPSDKE
jgi:hypothetical protein